MAAKYAVDLEDDFAFVKQSKQEHSEKILPKPKKTTKKPNINIDKVNSDNMNINRTDIHTIDKEKTKRPRHREPQSVTALREILLEKLDGQKETVVKMTEIAKEIGFSPSWMQFAMKYLSEHNEFTFIRFAEGKSRGMKIQALL